MDLYKRLIGYPYNEAPYDPPFEQIGKEPYLCACEMQRAGTVERSDVIGYFNFTSEEQNDHDDIVARMNGLLGLGALTRHKMEDIFNFVEQGWNYIGEGDWTDEDLKEAFGIT